MRKTAHPKILLCVCVLFQANLLLMSLDQCKKSDTKQPSTTQRSETLRKEDQQRSEAPRIRTNYTGHAEFEFPVKSPPSREDVKRTEEENSDRMFVDEPRVKLGKKKEGQ